MYVVSGNRKSGCTFKSSFLPFFYSFLWKYIIMIMVGKSPGDCGGGMTSYGLSGHHPCLYVVRLQCSPTRRWKDWIQRNGNIGKMETKIEMWFLGILFPSSVFRCSVLIFSTKEYAEFPSFSDSVWYEHFAGSRCSGDRHCAREIHNILNAWWALPQRKNKVKIKDDGFPQQRTFTDVTVVSSRMRGYPYIPIPKISH